MNMQLLLALYFSLQRNFTILRQWTFHRTSTLGR